MKKKLLLCIAMGSLNVAHAIQRLGSLLRNPEAVQAVRIGARSSIQPANKGMNGGIRTIAVEAGKSSSMPVTTQPTTWFQRFRGTLESPVNYVKSIFERRAQRAMEGARAEEGKIFTDQQGLFYNADKAAYEQAKLAVGNPNPARLRLATERYLSSLGRLEKTIKDWRGISEKLSEERPSLFLSAEERLRGKAYHDITEGFSQELARKKIELEKELSVLNRYKYESDLASAYRDALFEIQNFESMLPAFDEGVLDELPSRYNARRDEYISNLGGMERLMSGLHRRASESSLADPDSPYLAGKRKSWNENIARILEKYEQEKSRL